MAAADYTSVVQQLYVAYFGRPADPIGLTNLANQLDAAGAPTTINGLVDAYYTNATVKERIDAFGLSTESASLYSGSTAAFVNSIFQNVLNRAPALSGLLYWAGEIDAGRVTRGNAALAIMNGALANTTAQGVIDAAVVTNKLAVAANFTTALDTAAEVVAYTGSTAAQTARTLLANVTNTTDTTAYQATVTSTVQNIVDNPPTTGSNFTLTTSIDNQTGTGGNDTFNGSFIDANGTGTTTNPGDIINGGSGTDTVTVSASGTASPGTISAVNFNGVEKVLLSQYNTHAAGITVDMALADSSLTTVGLSSSGGQAATFSNLTKVVNAEMKNGNSSLTLGFNATANTGTADAVTLSVTGAGSAATTANFTAAGIETINVNSTLVKSYVGVIGANATTVNITGDTEVSVDVSSATNASLKTIDASAATGKVTVVTGNVAPNTAYTAVKGGAGTTDVFSTGNTGTTTGTTLANVTGFEVLKATGANAVVSLSAPLTGISTIDLTDVGAQTATLGVGYTGATEVKVGITGIDTINNTAANAALTVSGVAQAFATAVINGGTGTDTLNITADDAATTAGTQTARSLTGATGINTITIVADSATATKGVNLTNVKSTSSTVTLNVDASGLTNSGAIFNMTANATNTGKMSITGGAGNDLVDLNGSTAANTVNGGAGVDSITAGAGNDAIDGGAGNDIIVMGGNLTANDTINGGDGTDTLKVSTLTSSAAFANVTNVENIAITGTTTASLSSPLSASTTFDLTDTAVQSLTFATGYTGDTTVKLGATGVDSVTNSANVALTVTGLGAYVNGATVTGGTGTDTITLTADDVSSGLTSRSLANVSNVDTITVAASTVDSTFGAYLTTGASTWTSTTKTMTVDASALGSAAAFRFDGALTAGSVSVTGGAGNDTLVGGTKAETLAGGAGNDNITGSNTASINDNISGGDGNDTITMNSGAGTLDFNDTIDGGAGTDTLIVGTPASGMLAHVTNVEVLQIAASGSFGSEAIGFNTFDLNNTTANAAETLTLAAGFTGDTTVKMGLIDNDIVVNSANVALTMTGNVADFAGAITGGTGTDTLKMTADAAGVAIAGTSIDAITIVANSTATTGTGAITMAGTTIGTGKTLTVDASALTNSSAVLNISGAATTTTGKMSVTGGAGNDLITGTNNADTIVGGSGDDSISGGTGLDVLTGGAGNDLFVVTKNANGLTFAEITDAAAGDSVKFTMLAQASTVVPTKMTLAAGATTLSDYINAAAAGTAVGALNWFQFNGNTYIVADNNAATTFVASTDSVVQIDGVVDLATSIIATDGTTATWVLGSTVPSVPGGLPAGSFAFAAGATDTLAGGAGNDTFTADDDTKIANGDTVAGGLGTDTISLTENGAITIADAAFTKMTSIEKVALAVTAGANAFAVTLGTAAQAAGVRTIDLSADSNDTSTVDAGAFTTGVTFTAATGGAITLFTAGSGADSVTGSSAVDTLSFGANLTSADTIVGGGNTDVLKVSGTVADAAFTNVTTMETLDFTAAGSVTLSTASAAAGIVTVTNSGGAAITVNGSARTNALNITGGAGADSLVGGTAGDTIATGGGADSVVGGAGADTFTLNAGVDKLYWAATTAATLATEVGGAVGSGVTGETIGSFTSGADKLNFAAALLSNGTATQTLKAIVKGGTVAEGDVFVHVTDTVVGDNGNTHAGAVTVLNGLTTSSVAIGDSFLVAMDNDTNTYLYLVKQVSAADTIAAQDVTFVGVLNGITTITNGDLVFA